MFTVYVLQDNNGKVYKGVTNNLERRLSEHKRGKTRTTKRMKGLKLIYKERYGTFKEARKREIYLKTSAGRRFLQKILGP